MATEWTLIDTQITKGPTQSKKMVQIGVKFQFSGWLASNLVNTSHGSVNNGMVLGFVACDGICAFYKYAENTTCFNVGVHGDHLVSESNHD